MSATPYCDRYFGGVENVCIRLRDALQEAAESKKFPPAYIDGICGFGTTLPKKKVLLPTFNQIITEPEKRMTSLVFSLASSLLELDISRTLPIALSPAEKVSIAKEMQGCGVVAKGAGGEDVSLLPLEDQAPVYVISRVLSEVDIHAGLLQPA